MMTTLSSLDDVSLLERPVSIQQKPSGSLSTLLKNNKKQILELVCDTAQKPKDRLLPKNIEKRSPLTSVNVRHVTNLGADLEKIFSLSMKKNYVVDYHQDYNVQYDKLPDFSTIHAIKLGYYKALISRVSKDNNQIEVCLGKYSDKPLVFPLSSESFLGKDYLRGDEIVVYVTKNNGQFVLKQADPRLAILDQHHLSFGKNISYLSPKGTIIEGKIIGCAQDEQHQEVIFQPTKGGTSFALKLSTLLDGMKKAKEIAKKVTEPRQK